MFILLMIIAAFCDLQITKTLFRILGPKTGSYVTFWQTVGFIPEYFVPGFFLVIMGLSYKKNIYLHILFSFIGFFCFAIELYSIFYFMVATQPGETTAYNSGTSYILAIPVSLILFFTIYLSCFKISNENLLTLRKFGYVVIVTIIIEQISVFLLKGSFYRERYNQHLDDTTNWFQPWYSLHYNFHDPNITKANSFPSGHMSAFNSIYFLFFLPFVIKGMYKTRNILIFSIVSISLNMFCAIGRMAGGYHFLSDVTVSGSLGFALFTLFTYLFMFNSKISKFWDKVSSKICVNIILSILVIAMVLIFQRFM